MEAPSPLLLLLGALLVSSAANTSAASTQTVVVLVMLPEDLRVPWALHRVAPALNLTLETMEPDLRSAGLAVRPVFSFMEHNGTCDELMALFKAAELRGSHDPDVLLGLGCFHRSMSEESFDLYLQLPVLRAGYDVRRRSFRPVVYFGPVGPSVRVFKDRLLQHLNWTGRPVFIFPKNEFWLYDFFLFNDEDPYDFSPFLNYKEPDEAVWFIKARGRVVFLSVSLEALQQIMHVAEAQNMTSGDYVFFYLDVFGESLRAEGHREAAKPWQSKEIQGTEGLKEAFQTVLVITAHDPQTPEYRHFQSQLILRAQKDYGVTLNDSLENLVAGCYHDGLMLYLRALNETLREGGTKRNTSHILEKMREQNFQGVTGNMSINSKNVREMDFDLWAMKDVESGEFQIVAHYIGSEKRINWVRPVLGKPWRPALDNPPCYFDMDDPSCDKSAKVPRKGEGKETEAPQPARSC